MLFGVGPGYQQVDFFPFPAVDGAWVRLSSDRFFCFILRQILITISVNFFPPFSRLSPLRHGTDYATSHVLQVAPFRGLS